MAGFGRCNWMLSLACFMGLVGCLPGDLGPTVEEILADGVFTCQEQMQRDEYNVCPAEPPAQGTDAEGVTWYADLILGKRNPLHGELDCFRGLSPDLGISSYQCCYEGTTLVEEGPLAGTFDFANPGRSILTLMLHVVWDVISATSCP